MGENLPLWPARAAAMSGQTDALVLFLVAVTGFFTVVIFILIFTFAMKFRKEKHPIAADIHGSNVLEVTWSIIAFGKQWMWKFQHTEGQREINQLHVPLGRDVMLTMISQDVIHDVFIPAFRVKQDVLPGRYTTLWFRPIKPGTYHLFCSQYCGTMHSGMIGEVVVME